MNKYDEDLGPIEEVENHIRQAQIAAEKIKHVDKSDLLSELSDAEHECDMLEAHALEESNQLEEQFDD